MKKIKNVGYWNNNLDIELVEIEGEVYALYGWNGVGFLESWKCKGEFNSEVDGEETYSIYPIYNEEADEHGGYKILDYNVRVN